MNIGEKIKRRRKELKLSQRDLAAKMGYSHHSTIARIESGKVDVSQTRIVQFAEVLKTSVSYLMGWEEAQKKNDILTDAVLRAQTDDDFLYVIESIYKLDKDRLSALIINGNCFRGNYNFIKQRG